MDMTQIITMLKPVGTALLAGLGYTISGYLNHVVEQRKLNASAEWDWKKLGSTLTVSLVVGIGIGFYKFATGTEPAASYMFLTSIGGLTLLRKWINVLFYGKESVAGRIMTSFKKK